MVHLFALVRRLFPKEALTIRECKRSYLNPEGPASTFFDEPPQAGMAEACALLEGLLSPSGIEVSFEVLKQAEVPQGTSRWRGPKGGSRRSFSRDMRLTSCLALEWLRSNFRETDMSLPALPSANGLRTGQFLMDGTGVHGQRSRPLPPETGNEPIQSHDRTGLEGIRRTQRSTTQERK